MKEYNLFTKTLFEQGYSFEHYPECARLPNPYCDRHLFDVLGGFDYASWYLNKKVYATGCGLLYPGSKFSYGYMSYQGIDWKPENDNPVTACPYGKDHCPLRHPLLDHTRGGGLAKISQCNCHEVHVPYDYEQSGQKVLDENSRMIRQKYDEFVLRKENHVCHWHARYNSWAEEWQQTYDPMTCARYCMNIGGTCDFSHLPVSKKRGNIFYDVKITRIRRDDTFFSGQKIVSMKKGCRLLEKNTSLTICENIVRYCLNEIQRKEINHYHREICLEGWKVEVLNIRAEQRESRDLIQDLQDIQNGITVIHASDQVKLDKAAKRQRKTERREKREQKLEEKIITCGWKSVAANSSDYFHAIKWFGEEKIQLLEKKHQDYLEMEKRKPQQMSLFDMM